MFERFGVSANRRGRALPMLDNVLTLTATIQQCPPDHRGGYELERGEVEASADTYAEALGEIEARLAERLPTRWRILCVRVDRAD